jgi:hypothetical protein
MSPNWHTIERHCVEIKDENDSRSCVWPLILMEIRDYY